MSVPESVAWLEHTREEGGRYPGAQIYATTILAELTRLSEALNTCAQEVEKRDRLWHEERKAHHRREYAFDELERKASAAREAWDSTRSGLEADLFHLRESLQRAELMLKDVHWALLNQEDLTREEIANSITSVVTPYHAGERA